MNSQNSIDFQDLHTIRGPVPKTLPIVYYKRVKTKEGKKHTMPRLTIVLPKAWVSQHMTEKVSDRYKIMIGQNEHITRIRFIPDKQGSCKAIVLKGSIKITCGHVPVFGTDSAGEEATDGRCPSNAPKGTIEIDMPAWARLSSM